MRARGGRPSLQVGGNENVNKENDVLKKDSAKLCNKNEVFMGGRVIPAERLHKPTEMHSSLFLSDTFYLKTKQNKTKNPLPITQRKKKP